MPKAPLAGIRVLDMSRLLPGPYASLVLADLGASVDKLEDTAGGDYVRHMPPMIGDQSGMYLGLNRNKRSLCLDLKKPAAREAFFALLPRYDVVLEQFRPGVLDRLGLSHATMRAACPKLVVCALTGYGQDGPLALRAGHDVNYLARAGILGQSGPSDGPPQVPGHQLADVSGGLYSVVGILAALMERGRTGEGSVVDVAMVETSMGFASLAFGSLFAGAAHARGEEPLTGGLAVYGTYATKDGGAVSVGALEPKFSMELMAALGLPFDMSVVVPGPHQRALKEKLAEVFAAKTRAEWEEFAQKNDVCFEPVLTPEEATRDPHLNARGVFFELPSPWGPLKQMRTPVTPRDMEHRAPPRQGEHTDEILREAGLGDEAIARLRAEGAAR